jgi:hypothetical protein
VLRADTPPAQGQPVMPRVLHVARVDTPSAQGQPVMPRVLHVVRVDTPPAQGHPVMPCALLALGLQRVLRAQTFALLLWEK